MTDGTFSLADLEALEAPEGLPELKRATLDIVRSHIEMALTNSKVAVLATVEKENHGEAAWISVIALETLAVALTAIEGIVEGMPEEIRAFYFTTLEKKMSDFNSIDISFSMKSKGAIKP